MILIVPTCTCSPLLHLLAQLLTYMQIYDILYRLGKSSGLKNWRISSEVRREIPQMHFFLFSFLQCIVTGTMKKIPKPQKIAIVITRCRKNIRRVRQLISKEMVRPIQPAVTCSRADPKLEVEGFNCNVSKETHEVISCMSQRRSPVELARS